MTEARLRKIVSGGQTGVDRGALDAALRFGFPCGGWCPEGRLAEDGRIPDRYPVSELAGAGYRQRTLANLRDSDGTLILYRELVTGGTALTLRECLRRAVPVKLIDEQLVSVAPATESVLRFVDAHDIAVLNVAGPREGGAPGIRDYAEAVIGAVLSAEAGSRERNTPPR